MSTKQKSSLGGGGRLWQDRVGLRTEWCLHYYFKNPLPQWGKNNWQIYHRLKQVNLGWNCSYLKCISRIGFYQWIDDHHGGVVVTQKIRSSHHTLHVQHILGKEDCIYVQVTCKSHSMYKWVSKQEFLSCGTDYYRGWINILLTFLVIDAEQSRCFDLWWSCAGNDACWGPVHQRFKYDYQGITLDFLSIHNCCKLLWNTFVGSG